MKFQSLTVKNFRNYADLSLEIPPGIVVFYGPNGQGKTNLMEAFHFLLRGESFRPVTSDSLLRNYDFISRDTLAYFTPRLTQAPTDVAFALSYVKEHADTPEKQALVLDTLRFKCDVLWAQLDALYFAYVEPGLTPPGSFVPGRTAA